jgi:uncharacterized protein (DUF2235 family)
MPKKLVVCCDGTWNKPRDRTNIFRTYEHFHRQLGGPAEDADREAGWRRCRGRARDGSEVVLFYDKGVGTEIGRLLGGGAFGVGLSRNVCDAYHFLAGHYVTGDEIYVFGFSRGAYTARSLCGFIAATDGLLERPSLSEVRRAYIARYATEERIVARPQGSTREAAWRAVKGWFGGLAGSGLDDLPRWGDVRIRFLGVYDTVGALGLPLPKAERLNDAVVGFHDTTLGPRVEHAVQALAVDERRGPYRPTIWRQPTGGLAAGQTCLQVWFPGVHSDIGGGYDDKGIGDVTLDLILRRAAAAGLVLDPADPFPHLAPQPLPPQHDSFDAFWSTASTAFAELELQHVRPVGPTQRAMADELPPDAAGREMLHPLLVERLGREVTTVREDERGDIVTRAVYAPGNIPWSPDDIRAGRAALPMYSD